MSTGRRYIRPPLAEDIAQRIYDLLVEEAGASGSVNDRYGFVRYVSGDTGAHPREWRFCGSLGFGGKLHIANGNVYVDCYPEDRTPEREAVVAICNARLDGLVASEAVDE